jgi:hypothetical protein
LTPRTFPVNIYESADKLHYVIEAALPGYKPEELPPALTSYIKTKSHYDYQEHCEVGSEHSQFVTDDVVDRFCVLGPASAHIEKLHKLASVGVTQFNIYLMCGDEEDTLEKYKKEVLPAFQ